MSEVKENKEISHEEQFYIDGIKAIKPFLGRIKVEVIKEDVEEYLKKQWGVSEESKLIVSTAAYQDQHRVPWSKGKVLEIAPDAFGQRFENYYGKDGACEGRSNIKVGTIVYFVPMQTYKLDPQGKYHMINDEHIIGYSKR